MDRGSHYVCVDLPEGTSESGKKYSPFWTETGQARSPEDATTWPLAGPWVSFHLFYKAQRFQIT